MNLLLLPWRTVDASGRVVVAGRQATHLLQILKVKVGSSVKTGIDNRWLGEAKVIEIHAPSSVTLQLLHTDQTHVSVSTISPNGESPTKRLACEGRELRRTSQVDILVALPRPKTFDKVLQVAAALGVGKMDFVATTRTELAYFSSPKLCRKSIIENLRLGLEQCAVDPFYPEVRLFASWKSYLADLTSEPPPADQRRLVLHPALPAGGKPDESNLLCISHTLDHGSIGLRRHIGRILLAFGPEGGFINSEVQELVTQAEFKLCHLGPRILRVEHAVCAALSQTLLVLGHHQTPTDSAEEKTSLPTREDLHHHTGLRCWCNEDLAKPVQESGSKIAASSGLDCSDQDMTIHVQLPIRGHHKELT